ncbi:two-component system sensor histidine kinase CreC [Neisseria sp. Ec49-e6-T10]|uniref:two-component system sensor histidine kinase CreC n=1 Tax=Neisseria sp. Ec49-e6-T10 TaxID=3140744 RepID=UPI003EBA870E
MKISFRFLLFFFLLVALIGYFILNIFVQEIKPGIRRATENTLVDTANTLAQFAAQDMQDHTLVNGRFTQAFSQLNQYPIGAKIDRLIKNRTEYRVYITDEKGIVIFDSAHKDLGQDYSRWNDVYLTLRGKYGARSSKSDPDDETSSVMHVAAPIKVDGRIVGSLTVSKPNKEMALVIKEGERRIKVAGVILLCIALLLGLFFVLWINRSLKKLEHYATDVTEGKKVGVPKMDSPELDKLAQALEQMRTKLEGKGYIEQYVHTLTHELKSPLAAIKGAAEILQEHPPQQAQDRFLANILQQNERMQQLIDRMLLQAKVESLTHISFETVNLNELIENVICEKEPQYQLNQVELQFQNTSLEEERVVRGDALLLQQALSNLLDNALDFTPQAGIVRVGIEQNGRMYEISIHDSGQGIPDYALARIFERFYSLPRPHKAKSTGLGLSFVWEVALLHKGRVSLSNHPDGGALAILSLPVKD